MVSREELERFLDRLSAEGVSYTEVAPGLWRVRPGGALDFDLAVLSEALELGHLDYEEFRACFESMTIALGSHLRELVSIRDGQAHTGTHRAVSPDALHEAR
jgi:hypothetical protein